MVVGCSSRDARLMVLYILLLHNKKTSLLSGAASTRKSRKFRMMIDMVAILDVCHSHLGKAKLARRI